MKRNGVNRELTVEMVVGTFVATVIALLVVFTIILSRGQFGGGKQYDLLVKFPNVTGLRQHDNVVVRGMPVGTISTLSLVPGGVKVTARMRKMITLREGYYITIEPSSALGGHHMEIFEGDTNGNVVAISSVLEGMPPKNIMKDVSGLVNSIRRSLVDDGILDNLSVASAKISSLMSRLEGGEGTLGRLLSAEGTLYDDISLLAENLRKVSERVERGEGTLGKLMASDGSMYDDLSSAMAGIRELVGRVEKGEGTMGQLFASDDSLYEDISAMIGNLRKVTERVESGKGTFGALFSEDSALYDDLSSTVANIKTVSQRLADGEGLLGQMLSGDAALTKEVEGLLMDARATVDDFRESSPVVNFTSIFFGAF